MSEDTKLECLRLAVNFYKGCGQDVNLVAVAKMMYEWVTSEDKPNTIKYEKTLKERE